MATLFNTKIKDTYQSLLKLEDNTILTTTVKNVTDGLGNASPLYMSTNLVRIGSTSGSAMYWDNVNNRLGIGTSSPTEKLDVVGNIKGSSNLVLGDTPGGSGGGFQLIRNGNIYSSALVHSQSKYLYLFANPQGYTAGGFPASSTGIYSLGPILFMPDGTTSVSMLTNGNVLIGTTTDAGYKLDVNGTVKFGDSSNAYYATLTSGGADGGILRVGGASYGYAQLLSYALTLNGGHSITGTGGTAQFSITSNVAPTAAQSNAAIRFVADNPGSVGGTWGAYSTALAFNFLKKETSGSYTSILALNGGTNNVGIGTITPATELHIKQVDSNTSILRLESASSVTSNTYQVGVDFYSTITGAVTTTSFPVGKMYATGGGEFRSGKLRFQTIITNGGSLTDTMTLYQGNVAIGSLNTTPSKLLEVTGLKDTIVADFSSNTVGVNEGVSIQLSATAGAYPLGVIKGIFTANGGYSALTFSTSTVNTPTEAMRITSGQNVLIGTTTDSGYKLDVNGTLRSGIIYLTSNNGRIQYSTDMYMQFPAQGGPIAGVFADGGYGWNFQSSQIYSTLRPGNGTTTAASWSLSESVKSFGKNTFYITTDLTNASGGSATGETITLLNVNLGGPAVAYAYKPSLKLKAGNSGTHSGADQYARSGDLYLESGDANSGTANNVAGGTIYLSSGRGTGTGTPGNIILSTSTVTTSGTTLQTLTERMRINGSGNVMINATTDNGYKLNVNGTAFVSELITTGGMVKHNPYTVGVRALEIYSGIGHGGNTGVWASMYSTGVYGNGFDSYIGTQGYGVIGDPTNNAAAGYVNNIGVYGGGTLSNATGVYGTSGLFGKATTFRNASAALEVNSTTHGFLPPRMTAAQRSALTTITGFGTITGGSGYVDGTYYGVSITGGSGQNAYARITVSGGSVTSVALESGYLGGLSGGFGYTNGASVSASNTQLGGSGAGFSVIINASTPVGMMVYQTDATEGLYIYKSTGWTFIA